MKPRGPQRHQRPTTTSTVVLFLLVATLFVCLGTIFGPTLLFIEHHHDHHAMDVRQVHSSSSSSSSVVGVIDGRGERPQNRPAAVGAVVSPLVLPSNNLLDTLPDLIQLPNEKLVWDTIKSCLPDAVAATTDTTAASRRQINDQRQQQISKKKDPSKCGLFIPDVPPSPTTPAIKGATATTVGPLPSVLSRRRQRLGLLTPPGTLSQSLLNRINQLVHKYNKNQKMKMKQQDHHPSNTTRRTTSIGSSNAHEEEMMMIDVIVTSHIPPYGYGKNHGYTKLIRYVPDPLLLQVLDALSAPALNGTIGKTTASAPTTSTSAITVSDVIDATRLLLRWHCRISHIAAHTAVLSIPMVDFINNPSRNDNGGVAAESSPSSSSSNNNYDVILRAFVRSSPGIAKTPPEQQEGEGKEETVRTGDDDDIVRTTGADDDDDNNDHPQDDDRLGMVETTWANAHRLLSQLGGIGKIAPLIDTVILEELALSKNFTMWPCPSFWSVSSSSPSSNKSPVSTAIRRLARSLSPDCGHDPYVHCFVSRDTCEARGDAECRH